jgi:hypothetical protein
MPRKLTDVQKLMRSHMQLLKVMRGMIEEMGHLRRLLLEAKRAPVAGSQIPVDVIWLNGQPTFRYAPKAQPPFDRLGV